MKKLLVTIITALLTTAFVSGPVLAGKSKWYITSKSRYKIQLEFYSQNYNRAWPGGNKVYYQNDSEEYEYNLNCKTGEKICYGAWTTGNSDYYWGKGKDDAHSCADCCVICGDGYMRRSITD